MLVSGRELLRQAVAERHAVGSFNTYNLEITRAILQAAEAQKTPVFLAVGTGALDYAGFAPLTAVMLAAADEASVEVAVHLDHSPDAPTIERCVDAGFTSIMVDGSRLPFDDNVSLTKQAIAAGRGMTIEAELGGIAGREDSSGEHVSEIPMTDPLQAAAFVRETGIESLAIAIGNAHGFYSGEPRLDFERLKTLENAVPVPLVLHGASGISDGDIRRCIKLGVRKINVNTEVRFALFESLQQSLRDGVKGYDVPRLYEASIARMQEVVEEKIVLFRDG